MLSGSRTHHFVLGLRNVATGIDLLQKWKYIIAFKIDKLIVLYVWSTIFQLFQVVNQKSNLKWFSFFHVFILFSLDKSLILHSQDKISISLK